MNVPGNRKPSRPGSYYIGLPAWAFPGWKDRYFVDSPSRLASYASVFNCVEGNTTFYATPAASTVERWLASVPTDFRFCLKLPRDVTHAVRPDFRALEQFLDAVEPLRPVLGPLLVQLPGKKDARALEHLEPAFESIAARHRFVIEVRHPEFFEDPGLLEPWLDRYRAGRVILDSRPVHRGDLSHPEVVDALHEKPDLPVRAAVYGDTPFARLILHPDIVSNSPYLATWADRTAQWIGAGMRPFMMIHCPNNLHCPPLALDFHERVRRRIGGERLPAWPVPEQQALL